MFSRSSGGHCKCILLYPFVEVNRLKDALSIMKCKEAGSTKICRNKPLGVVLYTQNINLDMFFL